MDIDYKDLLKRYINYVSLMEGEFYWPTNMDFSEDEISAIERMINDIVYEGYRDER